MRVAIYSGAIPSTTFIENLINGVAQNGVEVLLFGNIRTSKNYDNELIKIVPFPSNRIETLYKTLAWGVRLLTSNPRRLKMLYSSLKRTGELKNLNKWSRALPVVCNLPDIFHVQWAKDIQQWIFLKQLGVKLIVSFRGTQINISPICNTQLAHMYREILPEYDACHCVSKAIQKEGEKYGAPLNKSVIIYPAVNKALISHKSRDRHAVLQILSVGRDHWKKGYRVALDAMKLLKDQQFRFHYTIISGGEKEELIHQAHQLDLKDHVTFIDNLPHNKVIEQYKNSDLFLLPSFEEGVANVVLEAMAIGVPVISTNCGGMEEVIKDGENGIMVPLRDASAIKNAVIRFSNMNEDEVKTLVSHAHDTILKNHTIDIQIEQMLNLYQNVSNS